MNKRDDYPSKFGHRVDGDCWVDLQCSPINHSARQHSHENFEVAYQLSGERVYNYSGELFALRAGDVLFIPPRTIHGTLESDDFQAYVLGYPPNVIYSHDISFRNMKYLLAFSGEHSFERCRFSGDSPEMNELRAEIVRLAGYGNSPMSELLVRASILRIHDSIYRLYNYHRDESVSEFIVTVQTFIEDHIDEDISPYKIADSLHISHSSLCHRLRAELGCTPGELINRRKLDFAESLLLERRELTVTEVGIEVGFPDTSYFIKLFKKSRGVTPNEFRKKINN